MKWWWLAALLLLGACTTTNQAPVSPSVVVRYDAIHHPVVANAGMVVSQNALATRVGQQILAQGGNAVDAAVAVGFALAVTLPRAGNVGGSGFMLIHDAATNRQTALDFRSAMPRNFQPEKYRGADGKVDTDQLKFGAHVAGVPGTVAGLYEAWQRGGSRPWSDLLQPAIELARDGIVVWHDLAFALRSEQAVFDQYPSSLAVYADADGRTMTMDQRWRQPDLAWTLQEIAADGADAFYRGSVARQLVDAVQRDGGYLTLEDLDDYSVRERAALEIDYRGHRVVSMPPVSGGGITLLQMLKILERFDVSGLPQGSAASLHLLAEVMKQGAANRRFGIGDPDYVDIPLADMLDPALIRTMADSISLERARQVDEVIPSNPSGEGRNTTHYSVVDRWGNAVSTTYTLGYSFGSGYVASGTGVLLDNQLRNFTHDKPSHANAPAPGKRMMSTMTPTLVLDDQGQVKLVTGTPGGGRIINVVLQVLVNVLDYDMNVAEATHAPRIHQPWRSQALGVERNVSIDTLERLRAMGHEIDVQDTMGSTQSIQVSGGLMYGAADPRRPGALAHGVQIVESQ